MKLLLLLFLRNRFALRNTFKKPLTCFSNCYILNYIVVFIPNEADQEELNSKNSNSISRESLWSSIILSKERYPIKWINMLNEIS